MEFEFTEPAGTIQTKSLTNAQGAKITYEYYIGKDGPSGFCLIIDGKDDGECFREQRKEFYQRIGIDIEQPNKKRGQLYTI